MGPNAFALHSLNLSSHDYKRWSEIDFVVAWEDGVFALEVKGGRVSCADGIWRFTNRFNVTTQKSEGPFDQAKSGHDALRAAVSDHADRAALRNICWGWGVMFPDITFDASSVSWSPELVADIQELSNGHDVAQYLRRLARWWRTQGRGHHTLADSEDLTTLCKAMRPDFDKVPSIGVAIDGAVEAIVRLTDEQLEVLDCIDANDRIVCSGGAGTGKSFLAVEATRRAVASGHSTILLCRSAIFAAFLRSRVGHNSAVVVDFDAIQPLLESGTKFGYTIIDEAQDLVNAHCMARIDKLIEGGLEGGRWRMFMDPNNQSGLHEPLEPQSLEALKRFSTAYRLRRNCRNTEQIVLQTQLITGADIGISVIEGQGPPIELIDVGDRRSEANALEERLSTWLEGDVRPGHITVLSPRPFNDSAAAIMSQRMASQLVNVNAQVASRWPSTKITFSTIRDFKGLENRCIAVVDLDAFDASVSDVAELYVAMTRAHAGLWMAIPRGQRDRLNRLITEHTRQILGKVAKP